MMDFKQKLRRQYTEVTAFSGADFSSPEAQRSLDAAADMANVYVDALGRICKRTGYKKVLQGEGNVNGIFCYEYRVDASSKKQYFVHIGTKLYFCDIYNGKMTLGTCISDTLEDKKSRGFMFGGALYILGAGYFKIMWDTHLGIFACGRVCRAEMNTEQNCIVRSGVTAEDKSFGGEKGAYLNAEARYKEVLFQMANYKFSSDGCKLYIVSRNASEMAHIVSVHYTLMDGTEVVLDPMHYQIGTDNSGLYVQLKRNDIYFEERLYCAPRVVFSYNNFVYTPTNIISRAPTVMEAFGDPMPIGEPIYDGELLEAFNLGAPQRAVEFYITSTNRAGGNGLRLYLENGEAMGEVMRIYIDGVLLQKYTQYINKHSEPVVGSYRCRYAEIESKLLPTTDCIVRVEYVKSQADNGENMVYATDACNVFGLFGGKNDTRVFLSGAPSYTGRDFASSLYDATYFPDTGYTLVGSDGAAIVGYHKISGYQVILKDGKNFDAAQYLRSYTTAVDGTAVFTLQQGAQGIGAGSVSSFKCCRDRMLFASSDGVYEIKSTDVAAQTNLKCLSERVRERLRQQPLADAVCAVLGDKYYLAVGTQMYILDTAREMQWYLYRDLPQILCLYPEEDALYFGAADGGVYRFMAESEQNAYYDNVAEDGSLTAARGICAYWDVPVTTLGSGYRRKSIEDFCVYLTPQNKSSVRVRYTTEFYKDAHKHNEGLGRFDFSKADFSDFSFVASDYPVCINTRAKAKRVRVFGVRIENAQPGEGMCISGIAVAYRENKPIK